MSIIQPPGGGAGTNESRFNTLAAAQAAAGPNDIIYVHRGNGTTAGQNAGITLNKSGQMLIGSGTDLTFDTTRFNTGNIGISGSSVLIPKTSAPLITNTAGNGVLITAENAMVAGINSSGATASGIFAQSSAGLNLGTITIRDVTTNNNTGRGIAVEAQNAGSLFSDVNIHNVTTNANTLDGILFFANNGGNLTNVNASNISANSNLNRGIHLQAASATSSILNFSVSNSTLNSNSLDGLLIYAFNDGDITNASVLNITADSNLNRGVFIQSQNIGSIISNVSLSNSNTNNNTFEGILGFVTNGSLGNISINGGNSNNNLSRGVSIVSENASSIITSSSIKNITTTGNTSHGLAVQSSVNGLITTAELSNNNSSNNGGRGISVSASGGADITTVSLLDNTASSNATADGILVTISSAGTSVDSVLLRNNSTSNNGQHGTHIQVTSSAQLNNLTFENNTATNNSQVGLRVQSDGLGTLINTARFNGDTSNTNGNRGTLVFTSNSGNITNLIGSNLTSNNNVLDGVALLVGNTAGNGGISSAILSGIIANNNGASGLYFQGNNSGPLSASLGRSTLSGNTLHGVYVDDDTSGAWTVDLGGGSLNSVGQNQIFSNTLSDIRVDMDNLTLQAENNWWGNALGLLPGRQTLDGASSIDSTPFLTSSP